MIYDEFEEYNNNDSAVIGKMLNDLLIDYFGLARYRLRNLLSMLETGNIADLKELAQDSNGLIICFTTIENFMKEVQKIYPRVRINCGGKWDNYFYFDHNPDKNLCVSIEEIVYPGQTMIYGDKNAIYFRVSEE